MNRTKQIIGIVGPQGSGKGAFASYVIELLGGTLTADYLEGSQILRDMLETGRVEVTTAALQQLGANVNKGEFLCRISAYVEHSSADIILLAGFRRLFQIARLRQFSHNTLVAIVGVPPEERWRRIVDRSERPGEATLTWEEFLQQERATSEQELSQVIQEADVYVVNTGTLATLEDMAHIFLRQLLAGMI